MATLNYQPEVEFKLGWQQYSPGQRIRPTGMLRDFLVNNGYAVIVEEKRKRGRPPKQR